MLGLLLVVGLSFAGMPTWTQSAEGRYSCSFIYSDSLYAISNDMAGAENLSLAECDRKTMDYDLYVYTEPWNMLHSLQWMHAAAGCTPDSVEDPVAEFRSAMISYNSVAANFKMLFNQCARSYMNKGGNRAELIDALNSARDSYSACIAHGDACWLPTV